MTMTTESKTDRIHALDDAFHRTFVGGAVMITAGVEAMPLDQRRPLLQKVRSFEAFGEDNDPIRSTISARWTKPASGSSGRSTITTVTPSLARPTRPTLPSRPGS
jgi:hypothetical protein